MTVEPVNGTPDPSLSPPPLTNGAFALELIQFQIRRLGKLQG
jgi:hypothetical protein